MRHLNYAQFLVRYGKNGTGEIFNCPIVSQILSVPILSVYIMLDFSFVTGKTVIDEIWTTLTGGPNFIRTEPKIVPSVNEA